MKEIELKFQVPVERRAGVDAAVAANGLPRRMRLQAAYVDTPERLLASEGMALRVRREGRLWVQTLKGAAADGLTRAEHNVPLGGGAAVPVPDPARHAGTPIGDRLIALTEASPRADLRVLFRTDILRRTRLMRLRGGAEVELAFDAGRILANDRHLPVQELEIELKSGSSAAVIETARRWVPRHGLWLDTRTKAERGDMLARGQAQAAARQARPVALDKAMTRDDAWREVLRACTEQITVNASQIADGLHGDEHVHQLRVGLRRLRSAQALFEVDREALAPVWDVSARALFQRLGEVRDHAVTEGEFAAELDAALQAAAFGEGTSAGTSAEPSLAAPKAPMVLARDVVRAPAVQLLLLDLLAVGIAPAPAEPDAEPPLRDQLAKRLDRWHRRAAADAKRFAELDDEARHRLRKRIKRLRYAVEFSASLFAQRKVRRYLKPLRALQERLGALNDITVAMATYSGLRDTDPRAWFALGWLAARRERVIKEARGDLRGFAKAARFWRRD